jgi:hypothetical protein
MKVYVLRGAAQRTAYRTDKLETIHIFIERNVPRCKKCFTSKKSTKLVEL